MGPAPLRTESGWKRMFLMDLHLLTFIRTKGQRQLHPFPLLQTFNPKNTLCPIGPKISWRPSQSHMSYLPGERTYQIEYKEKKAMIRLKLKIHIFFFFNGQHYLIMFRVILSQSSVKAIYKAAITIKIIGEESFYHWDESYGKSFWNGRQHFIFWPW